MTRYHLASRCAKQRLGRNNGRTREWLPIDIPAPRPCSAAFLRVPSHHTGLAGRFRRRTLLFTAFGYCSAYYTPIIGSLSTLLWGNVDSFAEYQWAFLCSICPDWITGGLGSVISQGIGFFSSCFSSSFMVSLPTVVCAGRGEICKNGPKNPGRFLLDGQKETKQRGIFCQFPGKGGKELVHFPKFCLCQPVLAEFGLFRQLSH